MNQTESQKPYDLKQRTKKFALRVIKLYKALPRDRVAYVLGSQVLKSGTSVGAQYREGCRARSTAEFISKLESALQEMEETMYWFELIVESELVKPERLTDLQQEADELAAILTATVIRAKANRDSPPPSNS
jgi:four helix bundle protein